MFTTMIVLFMRLNKDFETCEMYKKYINSIIDEVIETDIDGIDNFFVIQKFKKIILIVQNWNDEK